MSFANPYTVHAESGTLIQPELRRNVVCIEPSFGNGLLRTGQVKPSLVLAEPLQSFTVVVDAKDRTSGTLYDFRVDFGSQIHRARAIQLTRLILPKLNNVTSANNTIVTYHVDTGAGTAITCTLSPGLYNVSALSNEIASKINAAWAAAGVTDSVTVSFDTVRECFTINSVNVENFYISSTCTFITRGANLANFQSAAAGSDPAVTGATIVYSGHAGMMYTRWLTIHSDELTKHQWSRSRLSRSTSSAFGDIIAVIDLCHLYSGDDFNVAQAYAGALWSIPFTGTEVPYISVANSQQSICQIVDITIRDEFGDEITELQELGAPYPPNTIGATLVFRADA